MPTKAPEKKTGPAAVLAGSVPDRRRKGGGQVPRAKGDISFTDQNLDRAEPGARLFTVNGELTSG